MEEISVQIVADTAEPTITVDGLDTSFIRDTLPSDDIDFDSMRRHRPGLYAEYNNTVAALATAKTIGDLHQFNTLKKQFLKCVAAIKENGFSYSENIKADLLKQIAKKKGRLQIYQQSFRTLLATEQSLLTTYEKNRNDIDAKQAEIKELMDEIKLLEDTVPTKGDN